jgi:hypothetical protein
MAIRWLVYGVVGLRGEGGKGLADEPPFARKPGAFRSYSDSANNLQQRFSWLIGAEHARTNSL